MKPIKRNICIIGFDEETNNKFANLDYKNIERCSDESIKYLSRFPNIVYLKSVKEARRKQGFAVFINGNNIDDIQKFDIQNRKYLDNFEIIIIVKPTKQGYKIDRFSHIMLIDNNIDWFNLSEFIEGLYIDSLESFKTRTFHNAKLKRIELIYDCIKTKKTFSSKEISEKFSLSIRQTERYIDDVNYLYKNIGYDYSKNQYYTVL